MCPDRLHKPQQGAGLPVALFIITVLALLVVSMAQLQQRSGDAVSLQILSQRAFLAAESGAQIAVTDVLHDGRSCTAVWPDTDDWTISFSATGLNGCRAELQCDVTDVADVGGSGSDTLYRFVSRGVCGSSAEPTVREVEVQIR
jgi:MSHA biogenesis protein MshP